MMCLAKVAKFPVLLKLSVAMWLSSSDVESSRHSQSDGNDGGTLDSLRNVRRLQSR